MWELFGLEIARYGVLLLMSLVVFGHFWLNFDAWTVKKKLSDLPALVGLALLAFSFLAQAATFETPGFMSIWQGSLLSGVPGLFGYIRLSAYLLLMVGQFLHPVQKRPELAVVMSIGVVSQHAISWLLPVAAVFVALMYWQKSSIGLERHLVKLAISFFLLAFFEFFSLFQLFRDIPIVWISQLSQPFGVLTGIQYFFLVASAITMARWTWYYLLKRLSTQLYMLLVSGAVFLSLVSTTFFVSVLLQNIELAALDALTAEAKIVSQFFEEKKARQITDTKFIAIQPSLFEQALGNQRSTTAQLLQDHLLQTGLTSLSLVDPSAKIIIKGEHEEQRGVSLSEDSLVQQALTGKLAASITVTEGVAAPIVESKVVVPAAGGAVMSLQAFDTVFLDGLQETTGLLLSLYADKKLAATTITLADTKTRLMSTVESDQKVLTQVWDKGEIFAQRVELGDTLFLTAYVPLKSSTNEVVAVLMVSKPQFDIVQTASRAVQYTFVAVIGIMLVLLMPLYWITQKMVDQWQ